MGYLLLNRAIVFSIVALIGLLYGCAPDAASTTPTGRFGEETCDRFCSVIDKTSNWEEAFERATEFLNSVTDPLRVWELLQHSDKRARDHVKAEHRYGNGSHELLMRYEAAWEVCVYRLGELGDAGSDEALRLLVRFLAEGYHDAHRTEIVCWAIANVGQPAIPILKDVRGPRARLAEQVIQSIEKDEHEEYFMR